jgi:hypothetical protein
MNFQTDSLPHFAIKSHELVEDWSSHEREQDFERSAPFPLQDVQSDNSTSCANSVRESSDPGQRVLTFVFLRFADKIH